MTKIEWTEATWNPIVGCQITSPGCTNCYAMRMAHRLASNPSTPHYHGTTKTVNGNPVWTGKMALAPESVLFAPLKRKKPTTYFVNSMSDLFAENVPDDWIDRVFAVMALCPQHRFQVLTKRADRMWSYMQPRPSARGTSVQDRLWYIHHAMKSFTPGYTQFVRFWPLPNVWLGVSVEDQRRAEERIPDLLDTPAAVRFISAEPLLGPVDLTQITIAASHGDPALHLDALAGRVGLFGDLNDASSSERSDGPSDCARLNWIICGGESGPGARLMHPDWARSLRDQCVEAKVPFFFKQYGDWAVVETLPSQDYDLTAWPDGSIGDGNANDNGGFGQTLRRVGKKSAGRLLDGRRWDQMPETSDAETE